MNNTEKEFFWKDLSGRGFTNTFTEEELLLAFEEEIKQVQENLEEGEEDEESVKAWLEGMPEIGEEWRNNANKVIRIN